MIAAYHLILSAYGFWLPNDPRGSWSDFVGSWELRLAGGPATRVSTRQSLAHSEHDGEIRRRTKRELLRPPVRFSGIQARAIGNGFAIATRLCQYKIHACTIMPDHTHLIVGRHDSDIEVIAAHLKRAASRELARQKLHPFGSQPPLPTPWAAGCWRVFLEADGVARAVKYVEDNPVKMGLPRQRWSFVVR